MRPRRAPLRKREHTMKFLREILEARRVRAEEMTADEDPAFLRCETCNGAGVVERKVWGKNGPGLGYIDAEVECPECGGDGFLHVEE